LIKILFVGSFKVETKDKSVGGQMYACKSLINSDLRNKYQFILVDSTSNSVPAPHLPIRLINAVIRFFEFLIKLIFLKPSIILVFSSAGFSLIEKGSYVLLGNLFRKRTIFAPRSGLIYDQVQHSFLFNRIVSLIVRTSDIVLCQGIFWSKFYKSLDRRSLPEKFQIQYNWINTKLYDIKKNDRLSKQVTILYIGWLEEYKGVLDLIKVADKLNHKGVDFVLRICGSGSQRNVMKKLILKANLEGKVLFEGWVGHSRKLELLSESDIFVIPSYKEGFPNVMLEAMSCGLPVVTTNIGIVPEIIQTGINGLVFTPGDVNAFYENLTILLKSKEMRFIIGKQAKETVQQYSLDVTVKNMDKLFRDLIVK